MSTDKMSLNHQSCEQLHTIFWRY